MLQDKCRGCIFQMQVIEIQCYNVSFPVSNYPLISSLNVVLRLLSLNATHCPVMDHVVR